MFSTYLRKMLPRSNPRYFALSFPRSFPGSRHWLHALASCHACDLRKWNQGLLEAKAIRVGYEPRKPNIFVYRLVYSTCAKCSRSPLKMDEVTEQLRPGRLLEGSYNCLCFVAKVLRFTPRVPATPFFQCEVQDETI